jgi:hypothetical protein
VIGDAKSVLPSALHQVRKTGSLVVELTCIPLTRGAISRYQLVVQFSTREAAEEGGWMLSRTSHAKRNRCDSKSSVVHNFYKLL